MIFDMDGVLFDSHPIHRKAWREVLHAIGKVVSDEELDFILDGSTREEILQHFLGPLPEGRLASYARKKDLLFREEEANLRTIEGVESFLDAAETAGVPKVIATSASKCRAERMLGNYNLRGRFSAVITSDDVRSGKSAPEIFLRGADKLGALPSEVIVFEDAPSAIRIAKSVGMKCVGVARGKRRPELEKAGACLIVSDFTEVSLTSIQEIVRINPTAQRGK